MNDKRTADEKMYNSINRPAKKERWWSVIYHAISGSFSPKWYITVQRSRYSIKFSCGSSIEVTDNGESNVAARNLFTSIILPYRLQLQSQSTMYMAIAPLESRITKGDMRIIVCVYSTASIYLRNSHQGQSCIIRFSTVNAWISQWRNFPSKTWRSDDSSPINPNKVSEQLTSVRKLWSRKFALST